MASKLKKGDVVVATDGISHMHELYPRNYPALGTIGTVLQISQWFSVYVQWSKGSTSTDDRWYAADYHLHKVTKRDISLFVKYYDKYMQTSTTSVKQYYKCPSKVKQNIEERILDEMKSLRGCGYKILGGNAQRFIAAFMVDKILYVYSSRLVRVDTVFAKIMSDRRKEKLEELQALVNDAMADIISGDD